MNFTISTPSDKLTVTSYIEKLPENKSFEINISLLRKRRSLPQNSLYWLWLSCIAHETGNDRNYLHQFFGIEYLPHESRKVFQRFIDMPISTTTLDSAQFTAYLDKIRAFAASELGIVLPDPEDRYWNEFYNQYKNYL